MSKHPMVRYLHHLIEKFGEEQPGGKAVALQLQIRGQLQGWSGALRVHPEFPELFELMTVINVGEGPMASQAMASMVVAGEEVATVIFVPEAGQIVEDRSGGRRSPSGLVFGG
jgi:hypothetical protein